MRFFFMASGRHVKGALFEELFTAAGYDEVWSFGETVGAGSTLNEDYDASGKGRGSWGSQSLRMVVATAENAYVAHDFLKRVDPWDFEFEIYTETLDLASGQFVILHYAVRDTLEHNFYLLAIYNDAGTIKFLIQADTNRDGTLNTVYLGTSVAADTFYKLSGRWNNAGDAYSFSVNDSVVASGVLTGTQEGWDARQILLGSPASTKNGPNEVLFDLFRIYGTEKSGPVFRGSNVQQTAGGTSLTFTEPTGSAENDVLIMWVLIQTATGGVTAPSGWTNFYSDDTTFTHVLGYWIRRTSGAPDLSIEWVNTKQAEGCIVSYAGCKTSGNPYNQLQSAGPTTADPADPNPPSVTTTAANCLILALGYTNDTFTVLTAPSGYHLRAVTDGSYLGLAAADKFLPSATTEDPAIFDGAGGGSFSWIAVTMALEP